MLGVLRELVVVIIVRLEAFTRFELVLVLPAGLANCGESDFHGLVFVVIVVITRVAPDISFGGWRLAPVLDGRARVLVVCGSKPPFHHLEQLQ